MIAISACKQVSEGRRSQVNPNQAHPRLHEPDRASDPSQMPSSCECKCMRKKKISAYAEPLVTPLCRKRQNPNSRLTRPKSRNQSPESKRRTEKGRCVCALARVGTDNDIEVISVELLAASNAVPTIEAGWGAVLLDVSGVASEIPGLDVDIVVLPRKVLVSKESKKSEEMKRAELKGSMRKREGRSRTYINTPVDSRIVRAANTLAAIGLVHNGMETDEIFDAVVNCHGAGEVPILARNWDTERR
jgi:hypothetical protein